MRAAVFLDRDGVLIEDVDALTRPVQIRLLDGVPEALTALHDADYALVVVTNQTVISRGLATEQDVSELNEELARGLLRAGGPPLDGVYVCPHHPGATIPAYRIDCDCRKPRPGLLLRAADELTLDLKQSYLIGDRPSDVTAGALAGCVTILVRSGRHDDPPIESTYTGDWYQPDCVCDDLAAASRWILARG
jgi:D-glycero-D-manno-heptose 1,7-bisphosphate phosphatase